MNKKNILLISILGLLLFLGYYLTINSKDEQKTNIITPASINYQTKIDNLFKDWQTQKSTGIPEKGNIDLIFWMDSLWWDSWLLNNVPDSEKLNKLLEWMNFEISGNYEIVNNDLLFETVIEVSLQWKESVNKDLILNIRSLWKWKLEYSVYKITPQMVNFFWFFNEDAEDFLKKIDLINKSPQSYTIDESIWKDLLKSLIKTSNLSSSLEKTNAEEDNKIIDSFIKNKVLLFSWSVINDKEIEKIPIILNWDGITWFLNDISQIMNYWKTFKKDWDVWSINSLMNITLINWLFSKIDWSFWFAIADWFKKLDEFIVSFELKSSSNSYQDKDIYLKIWKAASFKDKYVELRIKFLIN